MLIRCSNSQYNEQKRYLHISPEQQGLKPSTNLDRVPLIDLIEPPPSPDDPRADDLNATALLLKMGSNFDDSSMSIFHPAVTGRRKEENLSYFGYRRNRQGRLIPTGSMPDYLSKIDFKYLTLSNGSKLRTKISSKLKRKIQQFLWAYTACPVIYRWRDLGLRFWPRYLKIGFCPQNVSCSIPPGMTCRASATVNKTLLRWFCKNHQQHGTTAAAGTQRRHCQWIKIEYPILSECSCSCPQPQLTNEL